MSYTDAEYDQLKRNYDELERRYQASLTYAEDYRKRIKVQQDKWIKILQDILFKIHAAYLNPTPIKIVMPTIPIILKFNTCGSCGYEFELDTNDIAYIEGVNQHRSRIYIKNREDPYDVQGDIRYHKDRIRMHQTPQIVE